MEVERRDVEDGKSSGEDPSRSRRQSDCSTYRTTEIRPPNGRIDNLRKAIFAP